MQKRVLRLLEVSRHITEVQVETVYNRRIHLRGQPYLRDDFNIAGTDSIEEKKYLIPVLPSLEGKPRIPDSLKRDRYKQPLREYGQN